ncbi:MAG: DUF6261 family protein [Tunicatimonas sp.]
MITAARLTRYRIKEFIQFVRNSLLIVSEHSPEQLQVKTQYNTLAQAQRQLEKTYKQDRDDDMAQRLMQLDATRDRAIVCLRMISEGYTRHFDAVLSAAGQTVLDCVDKYGARLYSLNYSAETAALKNVVRDLQNLPTCIQAIQVLRLGEIVKEMKRANLAFEKQFIEHLAASSRANSETMRELVQSTSEAYRTLVKHLEAHATLTPTTDYTLFINHFNENVEHFNQMVTQRKPSADSNPLRPAADDLIDALVE